MPKKHKHPYFSYPTQLIKPLALTYFPIPYFVKYTAFFWQLHDVGSQFPDQKSNLGCSYESTKS